MVTGDRSVTGHVVAAPRRRRPRRRGPVIAAVLLALGGAVGTGTVVLRHDAGMNQNDPALRGPDRPRPAVHHKLGVFLGADPASVGPYETWLGRPVDYVVEFAGRNTWAEIASPQQLFSDWQNTKYRMVFSLPMLPEAEPATIAQGATGAYDDYYRTLAKGFVRAGMPNTVFRVGWEFNLEGSRWATADDAAFKVYWRRIVAAMRSVPGQRFAFDWNPNNGKAKYDAVRYYPGDDVVDFVGVDAYDASWVSGTYPYPAGCDASCRLHRQRKAWSQGVYGGQRGLEFWSRFARHHGKPLSLPEWGLWNRDDGHGGRANPYYLRQMAAFIKNPANGVGYFAYFEYDAPDGRHTLRTSYPGSGAVYRQAFG